MPRFWEHLLGIRPQDSGGQAFGRAAATSQKFPLALLLALRVPCGPLSCSGMARIDRTQEGQCMASEFRHSGHHSRLAVLITGSTVVKPLKQPYFAVHVARAAV